jgi:hypothetical protein
VVEEWGMLSERKYCLIRIADFIEMRSTIKGIKAYKSKLKTHIEGYGPYEMVQVCYEGGRVLGVWDYRTFVGASGVTLREDGFREISKVEAMNLLKKVNKCR